MCTCVHTALITTRRRIADGRYFHPCHFEWAGIRFLLLALICMRKSRRKSSASENIRACNDYCSWCEPWMENETLIIIFSHNLIFLFIRDFSGKPTTNSIETRLEKEDKIDDSAKCSERLEKRKKKKIYATGRWLLIFFFFYVANYFGSVKFKVSRITRSIVEMFRRCSKIETKRFARENKNKSEQKRAMCVINKTRHVARQSIYLYKQTREN